MYTYINTYVHTYYMHDIHACIHTSPSLRGSLLLEASAPSGGGSPGASLKTNKKTSEGGREGGAPVAGRRLQDGSFEVAHRSVGGGGGSGSGLVGGAKARPLTSMSLREKVCVREHRVYIQAYVCVCVFVCVCVCVCVYVYTYTHTYT